MAPRFGDVANAQLKLKMTRIQIVAAKPNPTGRDKAGSFPLTRQLQGEWVDIQNTSSSRTSLSGVSFAHLAFGPVCSNPQTSTAWRDIENLVLEPNEVLRIHSGKSGDHWVVAGVMFSAPSSGG